MNITEKLLEARKMIKETSIKKEGRNTFSKYDYFTPSQVSELVNDVCQELNIITLFSLEKDEFGLYGHLSIADTEGKENQRLDFQMRTEMPSITATNMTQQMGGCETYTKRYMLMSAFDITDNNLDFDSQDNRPKATPSPPQSAPTPQKEPNSTNAPMEVKKISDDDAMINLKLCATVIELQEWWITLSSEQKSKFVTHKENRKQQILNKD